MLKLCLWKVPLLPTMVSGRDLCKTVANMLHTSEHQITVCQNARRSCFAKRCLGVLSESCQRVGNSSCTALDNQHKSNINVAQSRHNVLGCWLSRWIVTHRFLSTTPRRDIFDTARFSLPYDSVSCHSQAGRMSGDSIERARRARSTWAAIAPQQNALPDFSQIRPRPRQMNVWVALLDFFSWICKLLSMCCSTCSNMKFDEICTSKRPPSGKSQKVWQGTPRTKTAR